MKDTKTAPQHITALQSANRRRAAQRALLRRLSGNEISLEEIFDVPDAATLKLARILGALPYRPRKVGGGGIRHCQGAARRIAGRAGISLDREIGSVKCQVTKMRILNSAFDIVGRNAWVFSNEAAPKLQERKKNRPLGGAGAARRDAALARANMIRSRRKELKEQLRAGEISLADVFEDEASASWQIGKIVIHAARIHPITGSTAGRCGPGRAHTALRRARVAPTRAVRDLSDREKVTLVRELTASLTLAASTRRVEQVSA